MIAAWPREGSGAGARASFKASPGDFQVAELAAREPEGSGEHLYLLLEKTGRTTEEVARWLAGCFGVPQHAVGYAGMKDKHAIAEQWFSVHTSREADVLAPCAGIRLCRAARHARKLRRGELAGNRFRVRLRQVVGRDWTERLDAVRVRGVPNYFGPQRFGSDNLDQARAWLAERRRRRQSAFRAGLYLSVLRSFLFNEVLALRVTRRTWDRLLPGDVPAADGAAGSVSPGAETAPTGPLWGRGRSAATALALETEQAALAPHVGLLNALEHAGLTQARRSLVLRPQELDWQAEGGDVELGFILPPGGYATVLLAEVFDLSMPGAPA